MKDQNMLLQAMQNYCQWHTEAQQEIYNLYGKEYADRNEIRFREDGSLYSPHYITIAGTKTESTIQQTKWGKKVTAWKDSKYFMEV